MAVRVLTPMISIRRRRRNGLRPLTVALHATALLCIGGAAYAGGMAVIDASNLTQNTSTAFNMIKQVQQAVETVKQLTSVNGALGAAKQSVNVQMPGWNSGVANTVNSIRPNFDAWKLPKDVAINIGSPSSATSTLMKALDMPMPEKGKDPVKPSADKIQSYHESREAGLRDAAFRALGTAQSMQASAGDAAQSANAILAAPNTDLRQQTAQVLQAIVNVNLELVNQRQINAALLEMLAAREIQDMPIGVSANYADLRTSNDKKADQTGDPFEGQ